MGIVAALAAVCKQLREERGLAHSRVGYHLGGGRGKSESALRKFETGQTQPQRLDLVIAAYASELDMPELDIIHMAVDRLERGGDDPPAQFEKAVGDAARARRRGSRSTGRKPPAKSRPAGSPTRRRSRP